MLLLAVALTGIGGAMSVNARLVANPGDGIVYALTQRTGKDMGLMKNVCDFSCMTAALILGFVFAHGIVGVSIGTVVSVLLTGRAVWLYNRLCKKTVDRWSGLDGGETA